MEDAVCTWREVDGAFDTFFLKKGDNIIVYGAGPVGLSYVTFARLRGLSEITCVDRQSAKQQTALEMGMKRVFAPDSPDRQHYSDRRKRSVDAAIDPVGKEAIIKAALPLVKPDGSICVDSVIDTPAIRIDKDWGPYNFNLLIHQWLTRSQRAAFNVARYGSCCRVGMVN